MTDAAPPADAAPPPGPPPVALAIAADLVTRYRLRLADSRDSRLASLGATYELAAAAWTGPRAALVAFYLPPDDPELAGHDLAQRCEAARRWGHERLHVQSAQGCDILLVALRPVSGALSANTSPNEPVRIGAAWVDAERGTAEQLLAIPPGLPPAGELRARARAVHDGAQVPTLAAVDLAERQTVAGGYAAPTRRALIRQPTVTYAFIGAFLLVYVLERAKIPSTGFGTEEGLLAFGSLGNFSPFESDWWRYISSAFIHDPTDVLHILFNGLAMFWIGRIVEQLYGRLVLAGTFIITAVAGSLVWIVASLIGVTGVSISFGASGGISGLVGLLLVLGRVQGRNVPVGIAQSIRQYALLVIVINVVFGFSSGGINNFAHIGGLVAGALLGLLIPPLQQIGGRDLRLVERAVLGVAVVAAAVALVFAGVNYSQSQSSAGPSSVTGVLVIR